MSSITDFLRPSGGGLKPKYQEFLTSGTFTPTQALLDAGGVINVFIVGAGGSHSTQGAQGGEVLSKNVTITNLTSCLVTIGSGVASSSGGSSSFSGSSSGGVDVFAFGGNNNYQQNNRLGSSWGQYSASVTASAGNGTNGYGAGCSVGGNGGVKTPLINSGQGANIVAGGSGYCLITWGE